MAALVVGVEPQLRVSCSEVLSLGSGRGWGTGQLSVSASKETG